mmetsp:Transcript_25725/g.25543  ORF Transcript_25725/g.25543 Transcript_25725/m.25543 type:complete len:103 (+) Transcript_25725:1658-1966(+)
MTGGFLSKVKDSVDQLPHRHSEVKRYNHNYSKVNYASDANSLKSEELATSKCSAESRTNKEGSTYIENSSFSNKQSQPHRFSNLKDSFKDSLGELTPTFVED